MTQRFIRTQAGWSWPKRFLANLHEPPYISVLYGIWYLILTSIGAYSAFNPPITIVSAVGPVAPVTATLLAEYWRSWGPGVVRLSATGPGAESCG